MSMVDSLIRSCYLQYRNMADIEKSYFTEEFLLVMRFCNIYLFFNFKTSITVLHHNHGMYFSLVCYGFDIAKMPHRVYVNLKILNTTLMLFKNI